MDRNQILEQMRENHPSGAKMVEVSAEELTRLYGGGDVQAETTPACLYFVYTVGAASSNACIYTGGVVVGVTLSIWKC
ncbi:hypothetical protein D3C87_1628820 [compost metagenome]